MYKTLINSLACVTKQILRFIAQYVDYSFSFHSFKAHHFFRTKIVLITFQTRNNIFEYVAYMYQMNYFDSFCKAYDFNQNTP